MAIKGGFGFVQLKVVGVEDVAKVVQCSRNKRAGARRGNEANVVDDCGAKERGESAAVAAEYVGEGTHEKEGAQRVSLGNPFKQGVGRDIA